MRYVALLRGINVGGNSKVEMKRLKEVFEAVEMKDVRTYINSGNVLFSYNETGVVLLAHKLEKAIENEFGFMVPTIVKTHEALRTTVGAIKDEWLNNKEMKCDVVFLWDGLTTDALISQLKPRDGIDEVVSMPGAIIWKINREHASRSGLMRIMGTPAYRQVTVRNCNTVRMLLTMLDEYENIP